MLDTNASRAAMLARIDALRWYAAEAESSEFMNELSDKVYYFDLQLQEALRQRFGDENLRKMTPEWHKLVGSTVEDHDVNPEAKQYVAEEIGRFVSELETKWGLTQH